MLFTEKETKRNITFEERKVVRKLKDRRIFFKA